MFYEKPGKRIRDLRIQRGYSVSELAEAADISEKFLYNIENGKSGFSARVLNYIAIALDVDSDYILKGNENTNDNTIGETVKQFTEKEQQSIEKILVEIKKISNNK